MPRGSSLEVWTAALRLCVLPAGRDPGVGHEDFCECLGGATELFTSLKEAINEEGLTFFWIFVATAEFQADV